MLKHGKHTVNMASPPSKINALEILISFKIPIKSTYDLSDQAQVTKAEAMIRAFVVPINLVCDHNPWTPLKIGGSQCGGYKVEVVITKKGRKRRSIGKL